ncbi:MAG: adenylyl-sulfate kinase [Solirubrobacterales bacterium]
MSRRRASPRGVPPPGVVLWLTGLSGAGKSTISRGVAAHLREQAVAHEVLDGDVVREGLCRDLGFSHEDRDENVRRIAWVANLLARNGVSVIVAAISPYAQARREARALVGPAFCEVHVHASAELCAQRDTKGLYARAHAGEISGLTGVDDPYQDPVSPDLVVDTANESPEQSVAHVISTLARHVGALDDAVQASGNSGSPSPNV